MGFEPPVWVIVLNYQQPHLAINAVRSVLDSNYKNLKVMLVDNASSDNSIGLLKRDLCDARVEFLENAANLGFAGGNNPAIARALREEAQYMMLLNSDTLVFPETISRLVSTMEQRLEVGACTARCYFTAARQDPIYCAFLSDPSPWRTALSALLPVNFLCRLFGAGLRPLITGEHIDVGSSGTVHWFHGALMLVRRQAIADAGLLDENFFMFFEEIDWFIRMRQHGWQIYYDATAEYVHFLGGSSGGHRLINRRDEVRKTNAASRRYFMRKHYGRLQGLIFRIMEFLLLAPVESAKRFLKSVAVRNTGNRLPRA